MGILTDKWTMELLVFLDWWRRRGNQPIMSAIGDARNWTYAFSGLSGLQPFPSSIVKDKLSQTSIEHKQNRLLSCNELESLSRCCLELGLSHYAVSIIPILEFAWSMIAHETLEGSSWDVNGKAFWSTLTCITNAWKSYTSWGRSLVFGRSFRYFVNAVTPPLGSTCNASRMSNNLQRLVCQITYRDSEREEIGYRQRIGRQSPSLVSVLSVRLRP
jgi:hypothetical protein